VLAFSDAGLAHLAIAAGQVPRSRRKRWLMDLARHIELGEPLPHPGGSALRMRDLRARIAAGLLRLEIIIDEVDLVMKLTAHNLIDPNKADDKAHLARGVEKYLSDTSLHDKPIFDSIRISLLALALQRKRKSRGFKLSSATAQRSRA
jgi:hypothetical protein